LFYYYVVVDSVLNSVSYTPDRVARVPWMVLNAGTGFRNKSGTGGTHGMSSGSGCCVLAVQCSVISVLIGCGGSSAGKSFALLTDRERSGV
jgi:hypothetical protein